MDWIEALLALIGLFVVVGWTVDRMVKIEYYVRDRYQARRCARGHHSYLGATSGTCEGCGCPRYTPVKLGQHQSN